MKKLILTVLLLSILLSPVFAEDKELELATVPVVYGEEDFIARIQQRCQGREPVGLVLTGGSARALAHIGVLQYLEEHNIVPDFIIANSMGCIIATSYAAGMSPQQILRVCTSVDLGSLFDISLPLGRGLLTTHGFESLMASLLGENLQLEDLEIPVMVVSEDLLSKRQIRICSGDFYTAFSASYAMPVFFSPVRFEKYLLTDGGVANIAPLNAAYDYTDSNIVSTTFYSGADTNLKNPITVLNVAMDIGKRREGMENIQAHPDAIWIRCDVEDFSFMEFSAGAKMAEHGYRSASEHEEQINALAKKGAGVSASLLEKRRILEERIERTLENYRGQKHLTLHRSASYPSLWFLSDPSGVLAGWKYAVRDIALSAGAGFSYSLNSRNSYIKARAEAVFDFYPLPKAKFEAKLAYLPWKEFEVSELFEYAFITRPGMRVSAGELVSWNNVTGKAGGLIYAEGDFSFAQTGELEPYAAFVFKGADTGFAASASYSMNFPGTVFGFSVSGGTEKNFDSGNYALNAGGKLFWRDPEFETSFAETLLMTDMRCGVFADYTYEKDTSGTDLILGIFAGADTDLLGLVSLPSEIKLGWDFLYEKFYFSFSLNRR